MKNWIDIYTDGATSGNGTSKARGGWAYIFYADGARAISEYGGEVGTTNNRMELTAAIKGIEAARALYGETQNLHVISDSAYLCNCYEQKWYRNWEFNGWVNSTKGPVANRDLWEKLIPYFTLCPICLLCFVSNSCKSVSRFQIVFRRKNADHDRKG